MNFSKLFYLIKESFKDIERDYTNIKITDAIILLSIPMIMELSLESVFAVVDMFFVSKLGQIAIATVGLTESVVTLIYSLGIGISTGATAIISRRIGEKKLESASQAAAQSLMITLCISLFISVIGLFYSRDILEIMGARPEVIEEGYKFTQITLIANLPILLLFINNGIFRGAGNATMAMKSLWFASGMNIILCPIFIHFWGLPGAAYATVLGRSSGVIYQFWQLTNGHHSMKLNFKHFIFKNEIVKSIFNISTPATFQFLIGSGSWIILTKLVAEIGGTSVSAAYQISFRVFVFFILPAWGLSNAAATLVGQNLGAKEIERAENSIYITAKISAVLMALTTLFLMIFAEPIVKIFSEDPLVIHHAVESLRLISSGFILYGVGMIFTQALNGAGDSKAPTWINILCFWVFQIPFAYWLAKGLGWGAMGAIISVPVSNGLLALLAWLYLKKGNWKTTQV